MALHDFSNSIKADALIDFEELFALLWYSKYWIIFCIVLSTAAAWSYILISTPYYSATVLVQAVSKQSDGSISGLSKSLGGLSSLVGLNDVNSSTAVNLATLSSRQFLTHFLEQNKIVPVLYASQSFASESPKVLSVASDAYQDFSQLMAIQNDKKTGLINLTIQWKDPQLAANWANELVAAVNAYLREDAIKDTKNSILYLQKMASETKELEIREVIYQLLANEIQSIKMANIRSDFAFKVIDPAVKPKLPSKPKKMEILMMGFFVGCLLAAAVVLLKVMLPSLRLNYLKLTNLPKEGQVA